MDGAVIYRLFNKHLWSCPGGLPPSAGGPGASPLRSRVELPLRLPLAGGRLISQLLSRSIKYKTALGADGGEVRGSVSPATWGQLLRPQSHIRHTRVSAARRSQRPPAGAGCLLILSGAPALPRLSPAPTLSCLRLLGEK